MSSPGTTTPSSGTMSPPVTSMVIKRESFSVPMRRRPKALGDGTETTKAIEPSRKRRAHTKSRLGCKNCKMRSVKCDEAKPSCGRCVSSGYTCTYSSEDPALQFAFTQVFKLDIGTPTPARFLQKTVPFSMSGGRVGTYEMRPYEIAAIDRYLNRTVLDFATAARPVKPLKYVDMANANPFLYHVFAGLSILHDIHLADCSMDTLHAQFKAASFHWYQVTRLLQQKVSRYASSPNLQIDRVEKDSIWMCSNILALGVFANVESFNPIESWPLKPPESVDLSWIKLDLVRDIVFTISKPADPDSHYHSYYQLLEQIGMPDGTAPIRPHNLSAAYYPYFNITPESTADNNPYHHVVAILSQIQSPDGSFKENLRYLSLKVEMRPEFVHLLELKDPRALLLLVIWYSKLISLPWWFVRPRAIVEGTSICMYLRKHHSDDAVLMGFIEEQASIVYSAYNKRKWGNTQELERQLGIASPPPPPYEEPASPQHRMNYELDTKHVF